MTAQSLSFVVVGYFYPLLKMAHFCIYRKHSYRVFACYVFRVQLGRVSVENRLEIVCHRVRLRRVTAISFPPPFINFVV